MIESSEIDNIQKQINELHKKQEEIFNNQIKEKLLNLDWLECCDLRYIEEPFCAAGIPYYKLEVTGSKETVPYQVVTLYGSSKNYQDNICYGKGYNLFEYNPNIIYTNNFELLIEFLKKIKYKSLTFDTEKYERMSRIKELSK